MRLALFDLDYTLLPIDSDHAWGEFTVALGWCDRQTFGQTNDRYLQQYQAGTLDIHDYVRFATAAVRARGNQEVQAARARFMQEVIGPQIRPAARELVQHHREAGDTLLMVTATNALVTQPIARAFGITHLVATELSRDARGQLTGEIEGVPSFRQGKVQRVEQWLQQRGLEWAQLEHSVFYTDSLNDLALMQRVHEPVATNPDAGLRAHAQREGWRILQLFHD